MSPFLYRSLITGVLLIIAAGCQPLTIDNTDNDTFPLKLEVVPDDERGFRLSWDPVNVSSFEEYLIIRGVDSLPFTADPLSSNGVLVTQLDERSQTGFTDETSPPFDQIVYRIYANIGDRFLASNSVTVTQEFTSLDIRPRSVLHRPGDSLVWIYDRFEGRLRGFNLATNQPLDYEITNINSARISLAVVSGTPSATVYLTSVGTGQLQGYDLATGQKTLETNLSFFITDMAEGRKGELIGINDFQLLRYDPISQSFSGFFPLSQINNPQFIRSLGQQQYVIQSSGKLTRFTLLSQGIAADVISNDNLQSSPSDLIVSADGEYIYPLVGQQLFNRDLVNLGDPGNIFATSGFGPQSEGVFYKSILLNGGQTLALQGQMIATASPIDTVILQYNPRSVFSYEDELVIVGEFCCDPNTFQAQTIIERFVP